MYNNMPNDLQDALQYVSETLETKMSELLRVPENDAHNILSFGCDHTDDDDGEDLKSDQTVIEAMRYSALSGGKRLRPFLTVCSSQLFGVSWDAAILTAAALEFVHTYSLIHDDLPAMDDDPLRRGKASCHVQFGEAAAILAGDGLLTYAFQILADAKVHANASVRCELIRSLSLAAGCWGMVGGQMMDLEAENKHLSKDAIIRLQRLKTGELFAVSCEAGAILGKAPGMMRHVLRAYAHDLGLAFQITDDLLDAEGSRIETGKEVNKDRIAGKATLVSLLGIDQAREHAKALAEQAARHLDVFDKRANRLRELSEFVVTRNG